ncbi:MAG: hypothetical protein DBP02_01920 [gamma proteobacterium symbiont of Ctena orbiculata]|nr:MAG: hypothetical protein DBP02_01920 [gamma proteobacterium symbiont of Ctena orbiculata]
MRIKQDNLVYKPITIILETAEEARAFIEIMDEVDARTPEASRLATTLSNAFTNCSVEIPEQRCDEYSLTA